MSKEVSEPSVNKEKVPPFTIRHIVAITELAQFGLNVVRMAVDSEKENPGKMKAEYGESAFAHIQELAEGIGPESVLHFQAICAAEAKDLVDGIKNGPKNA